MNYQQEAAIAAVHRALADEQAGPPENIISDAETRAYYLGMFRAVLKQAAAAFPEGNQPVPEGAECASCHATGDLQPVHDTGGDGTVRWYCADLEACAGRRATREQAPIAAVTS